MPSRRLTRIRDGRAGLALLTALILTSFQPAQAGEIGEAPIPELVTLLPFVPDASPADALAQGTFTLVATRVPVDELLPALARKAGLNIDLPHGIQGEVTLNLTHRPLPEILDQIGRQTGLRYTLRADNTLSIAPANTLSAREKFGPQP
ncbi:MAG: hypothetical protein HQL95_10715 [Magnetococcales bacterium]|nr:hypothetical protein [Magnetococcales bacterium]